MIPGFSFFGIFSSPIIFVSVMVVIGGLIGAVSGKLSIASFGAFLVYIYIAVGANLGFYTDLLYLIILAIIAILGFNVWDYFGGENIQ